MDVVERAQRWIARDPDPNTRSELQALVDASDLEGLRARLDGRLAFGTAGLRGVLGAGPLRMNRLVVRETSAGLGAYLLETLPDAPSRGVVIGYDGRHGSVEFAQDTASVLGALGIRSHLFDVYAATPLTAFAVTTLNAAAGIMVTASHNPPEYNGYKVYWGNGAQIIPPHDSGIARHIDAAASAPIPFLDYEDARAQGFVSDLGEEMIRAYLDGVQALRPTRALNPDALTIVYTPMHGIGAAFGERALADAGYHNVHTVAEQREPDGDFPTVRFPNPEEPGALDLAKALATKHDADIILANDPDADRLAVAVRRAPGDYLVLTGDQTGALLGSDRISFASDIEGPTAVATTIVSSQLLEALANARGVSYFETLTGFKWIANGALDRPDTTFLFGYEEAIGFTLGELVRDKDGVSALVGLADLAASLKARGETLLDMLESLYREFGVYLTAQKSLPLGVDGISVGLVDELRADVPTSIHGLSVLAYEDLSTGVRLLSDGTQETIDLPKSNVLVYRLETGARVIVRPSGTEPKLKCYYEVRTSFDAESTLAQAQAKASEALTALMTAHQTMMRGA